ncbi:conserved hypothetical protein [Culex quinquefasciatus]|uniref:Uncharacterized protein n=1 Tax=Culex quinquefasciatus TaxID=7176 RepID=B0W5S1_CULQU|nr:conserved hypothetical protein [Culex quinquefasciatus]|eukprot:XP_001844055.1 conserved hypothetical protein [Culex quinquefasciatus]
MEAFSKNENYFYKVSIYTNTCKKINQLHQDSKKQKNSELSPIAGDYNSNLFPSLDDSLNSLSLKYEKQLLSSCGRQWIWKEYPTLKKIDQLNLSARFAYVNMDIRLHNEGCLMATEHNFVAQVRIEDSALLDGVGEFEQARAILIDQLRVTKVIRDDLRDEQNELRGQFVEVVKSVIEVSATDCLELLKIKENLVKSDNLNYRGLCREIYFNRKVSTNLKIFAKQLLELEEKTQKRSKWFARFEIESEEQHEKRLEKELTNVLEENIEAYRRSAKNYLKISDEIYIWYCMLDHVLANVFSAAEVKRGGNFEHFRPVFQRYTNLMREVGYDQVDAVRRISHALARYVVQVDWFQKHVRGKLQANIVSN